MRKLTTSMKAATTALADGLTGRISAWVAEWQRASQPLRPIRVQAHSHRGRTEAGRFNGR